MNVYLKIAGLIISMMLVIVAIPLLYYFPGYNWRTVEEGAFYGSRQMSGRVLEKTIKKYGIKTVINLRGVNPGTAWYEEEVEACRQAGVKLVSLGWSKNSLPDPESLLRFVNLIEKGEKPFLAHCQGGTHRTAIAAACYELLRGQGMTEARKQLGPMFNDAPIGELLDLYEESNTLFRQWVREVYPSVYERRMFPKEEDTSSVIRPAPQLAFATP